MKEIINKLNELYDKTQVEFIKCEPCTDSKEYLKGKRQGIKECIILLNKYKDEGSC